MKNFSLLFLFLLLFSGRGVYAQGYWKLVKKDGDISVFIKTNGQPGLIAFRLEAFSSAGLESFETVLDNIEGYSYWQKNLDEVSVIENKSQEKLYYLFSDLPWPISDREMIINSLKKKSSYYLEYRNQALKHSYSGKPSAVREEDANGFWKFTKEGQVIKIVYEWSMVSEFDYPDWLKQLFLVDAPLETVKNLKKMVGDR